MRLAVFAAGLLAACAAPREDAPLAWEFAPSPAGAALMAADAQGPVLEVRCLADSRQMRLTAFRFDPVASNEEFSFGTDDEAYLFVADPAARTSGVTASGPIFPPLLNSFLSSGTVSAAYGAQTVGPLSLPPRDGDAFAGACRGML